jgi:hypothetical protein
MQLKDGRAVLIYVFEGFALPRVFSYPVNESPSILVWSVRPVKWIPRR